MVNKITENRSVGENSYEYNTIDLEEDIIPKRIAEATNFAKECLKIKKLPMIIFVKRKYWVYGKDCLGMYFPGTKVVAIQEIQADKNLLDTLFHELTHHKQFEAGWLKELKTTYQWMSKGITKYSNDMTNYKYYYNAPHEVHARKVAAKMVKEFNNQF